MLNFSEGSVIVTYLVRFIGSGPIDPQILNSEINKWFKDGNFGLDIVIDPIFTSHIGMAKSVVQFGPLLTL